MLRSQKIFIIGLLALSVAFSGCDKTLTVRVPTDSKWHSLYSVQVPDVDLELEIWKSRVEGKAACKEAPEPQATQIRIMRLTPFPDYDNLPDTAPATGVNAGLDTGPLDLASINAKRIVPISTGKEILVRSNDPCSEIRIRIFNRKNKRDTAD